MMIMMMMQHAPFYSRTRGCQKEEKRLSRSFARGEPTFVLYRAFSRCLRDGTSVFPCVSAERFRSLRSGRCGEFPFYISYFRMLCLGSCPLRTKLASVSDL